MSANLCYSAATGSASDEKPFIIVVVERDVAGYSRLKNERRSFGTFEEAMAAAAELNVEIGVTPDTAMEIVASSFRAQRAKDRGRG